MPSTSKQHETMLTSQVPDERPSNRDVTGTGQNERPPSAESKDSTLESTTHEIPSSEFHASSEERQLSLMRRKQEFLQTARR